MRALLGKAAKSPLVRSSVVLSFGMMAANVSNYLFHLLMGRFLGPVDYGILASLISLLYILMVPMLTIQTAVGKFSAEHRAGGELGKTRSLWSQLTKRLAAAGAILFVAMVSASGLVSRFLNIESVAPVVIVSAVLLVVYVLPVNRGVMLGFQEFGQLSFSLSLETVLKLLIGLTLVAAGFSVAGAVAGIVISMMGAYALSFWPLTRLLREPGVPGVNAGDVLKYSIPVFVALFCMNAYYSIDVILARHFLSGVDAGHYSGLSILGKIVVFASLAMVNVMFPAVAGLHKRDEKHSHYLAITLAMVGTVSGGIVVAYFIAPVFLTRLLFGTKYLAVAPFMGMFGVAMLLLALASVFVFYYLAIRRTGFIAFLVAVAAGQAAALWLWHGSIGRITLVMLTTMAVLLAGLVVYYVAAVRVAAEPAEPPPLPLGV